MKSKTNIKKLQLNKKTISNMDDIVMDHIKGGTYDTINVRICYGFTQVLYTGCFACPKPNTVTCI